MRLSTSRIARWDGVGRKRQLLDVVALLRFAVTRAGAADRWMPPPAEVIEELIGHADHQHQDSTPIKPEPLGALLDALRQAGREDLHLAVALVGLFGLRPSELGVLRVEEGRLYVGSVKRNIRTLKVAKQERRVLPLDLPGREGEGARAVALLDSGLVKLPTAIGTQIEAGPTRASETRFGSSWIASPSGGRWPRQLQASRPTACGMDTPGGGTRAMNGRFQCGIWRP